MEQQSAPSAATESPRLRPVGPFDQFQGFSAASTGHDHLRPRFGVYGYHIPEENISPRMPIPNPAEWELPQPQPLHGQSHESVNQPPARSVCRGPDCSWPTDIDDAVSAQQELARIERERFNSTYPLTPASTYWDDLLGPLHGVGKGPCPPPEPFTTTDAARNTTNTYRVPSDSEATPGPTSPRFDATEPPQQQHAPPIPVSASTLSESASSTIYPGDSVSAANSRAGADGPPQRTLADDIVDVHDICLVATQRYLEALRVNWDLRHGRPLGGGGAVRNHRGGGGGGVRDSGRRRWLPYPSAVPSRRRARSEGSLAGGGHRNNDDGGGSGQTTEDNPIPGFTNSLLHNIHHVCSLVWRRAQRDREDVLGAEVKACRDMGFLHEYGETVVLYNTVDGEGDPKGCLERVVTAGYQLCRWLGDGEGVEEIEERW